MDTKWWFKIEDAGILLAAVILCFRVDARWYVFAGMALAPDLGMLGYLGKIGPSRHKTDQMALEKLGK